MVNRRGTVPQLKEDIAGKVCRAVDIRNEAEKREHSKNCVVMSRVYTHFILRVDGAL